MPLKRAGGRSPSRTDRQKEFLEESYSQFRRLVDYAPSERRIEFANSLVALLAFISKRHLRLESGRVLKLAPNDEPLRPRRRAIAVAWKMVDACARALIPVVGNSKDANLLVAPILEELRRASNRLDRSGGRNLPDFNRRIGRIVRLVHEVTGQYHDGLLAEIIGSVADPSYPRFPSEDALRRWRSQHKLTG